MLTAWRSDGEGGEEARPVLDAQQAQGHEGEGASHTSAGRAGPGTCGALGAPSSERVSGSANSDHRNEQRRPTAGREEPRRSGQPLALVLGLLVVVDAEEAGVEAQAEDDLGDCREQDEHAQMP